MFNANNNNNNNPNSDLMVSNPPSDTVSHIAYCNNSSYFACTSWDKKVRFYQLQNGQTQMKSEILLGLFLFLILQLFFLFQSGGWNLNLVCVDFLQFFVLYSSFPLVLWWIFFGLTVADAPPLSCDFSDDGKVFAAGCDNKGYIWDLQSNNKQQIAQVKSILKNFSP